MKADFTRAYSLIIDYLIKVHTHKSYVCPECDTQWDATLGYFCPACDACHNLVFLHELVFCTPDQRESWL